MGGGFNTTIESQANSGPHRGLWRSHVNQSPNTKPSSSNSSTHSLRQTLNPGSIHPACAVMPPYLIPNPSLWQPVSPTTPSRPARAVTRGASTISETSTSSQLLPPRPGTSDLSQPTPSYRLSRHHSRNSGTSQIGLLQSYRHSQEWEDIELQEIRQQQDTGRRQGLRTRRKCNACRKLYRVIVLCLSWRVLLVAMLITFIIAVSLYATGTVNNEPWN